MSHNPTRYLAESFPNVAREFDIPENNGITPDQIAAGSHRLYWWKCSTCGYRWKASPNSRTSKPQGCPVCGRKRAAEKNHQRKIAEGKTLANLYPEIAAEWDAEKNGDITPEIVSAHAATKAWWLCNKCGSSWEMPVCKRTQKQGQGCPVCAGVRVIPGINDLETVNPLLAKEWDYELNSSLPSEVTAHTDKRVHWVCFTCGHQWTAAISVRNTGTGCPKCKRIFSSSLPEQIILFYLKQVYPDTMNYRPDWMPNGEEIDIYIPSLKIGVEYDGIHWHADPERDRKKGLLIKDQGILLIRVRDISSEAVEDGSIRIEVSPTHRGYHYMDQAVYEIFVHIMHNSGAKLTIPDINSDRDLLEIRACYGDALSEKSFAAICPELIPEWDFEKNGKLNPASISAKSEFKVHWHCSKCGNRWFATIADRTAGHGCPYCSGLKVREGYNDLQTMRPDIAAEWDKFENILPPNKVSYRSAKKASFICKVCGYHYSARIADRSAGSGCPACAGKVVRPGVSDLATLKPELLADWDYEQNPLPPSSYTVQSNKVVAWKCHICGYKWKAAIYSRTNGRGCMKCGKRSMAAKKDKQHLVAQLIQQQDKWLSRAEILALCHSLSEATVNRAIQKLLSEDAIERRTIGTKASYRWKKANEEVT